MPQTMTSPPMQLDPTAVFRAENGKRALAPGLGKRGLTLGLGILILALGAAWFASSQLQPTPEPARDKQAKARAGLDRATLAKLDLSTFQRRGALLVGEVTTAAGVRLRVVMDANTREVVGLRVLETEAGTTP